MKKRVKTVKEYDEICSEKAEGYVFLPEKDMDCLVEYVQTLGKTLKKDEKAPATIQYKYSYEKKCSIPVVKIQKYVGELDCGFRFCQRFILAAVRIGRNRSIWRCLRAPTG